MASSPGAGTRAGVTFAALGAASVCAYVLYWLRPLWLAGFRPFDHDAESIATALGVNWNGLAVYASGFLAPIFAYVSALLILPRVPRRTAWRIAIVVAIAAPLVLLFTYPALAADVFDYLMIGRLLAAYHVNPYTHTADWAPGDTYYGPVGWKLLPSVYGPLWVAYMGIVVGLCGKSAIVALLVTKATAVVAHWGVCGMVYFIARRLDPGRALFAFVAYAWNPLVLVHFAVDGHNDAVLLLFLMVAVWFALEGRWGLALPALALSTLVKFVPIVLLPLLLWHGRGDRRALALGLAVSAVLMAVMFAPFWAGSATFDGVRDQASRLTSSPAAVASFVLPDALLRPIALVAFVAGYLFVIRRKTGIVEGCYGVLLLYLVVLSFWTKPWYFTWLVALGAVLGGRAFWASVAGMVGLFASNLFGAWGWLMDWLRWQERWGQMAMEGVLAATTLAGWVVVWAAALTRGLPRGLRQARPALARVLARPAR